MVTNVDTVKEDMTQLYKNSFQLHGDSVMGSGRPLTSMLPYVLSIVVFLWIGNDTYILTNKKHAVFSIFFTET
jgi:hypothetical protein